jgi:PREDICTED: similar to ribonuclease H2, large subunit
MNLDQFLNNCDENCVFKQDIPSETKSRSCILGIDEAGRGPVLGKLIIGIIIHSVMHLSFVFPLFKAPWFTPRLFFLQI